MTEPGRVKVKMDGTEYWVDPKKPLLQSAIDLNISVPHFCYHPGIGIDGNCRLCMVEIEGMPKLQTSCTTFPKEGMSVKTHSAPVEKARKGVLEFFLLNHPLDCPICDKGGECPLQNYSLDAGQSQGRTAFPRLQKAKHQVIGDHIILDKERCVLCNRCVRFMRDLVGHEDLSIGQRGVHSEIMVAEGGWLTNGFTGNLADMCPVGALTTREFRFRARPWEMKTVDSACGECSLVCSAQVWRKGNTVLRMTPRVEPAVNEWWLCDRGRFSVTPLLGGERLKRPQGANGSALLSPEETAAALAREIRSTPRGSLALVADAALTNEEFYLLRKIARLTSGRVFAPVSRAAKRFLDQLREKELLAEFPETLENASSVAVVGENLETDHPVLALRLRKMEVAGRIRWVTHEKGTLEPLLEEEQVRSSDMLFVSSQLLDGMSDVAVDSTISALVKNGGKRGVSLLLAGTNVRGMLDQWDERSQALADLEREIQRGTVEGLLWFGKAPSSEVYDEYARGMRFFAQFVLRASEAHSLAKWVLPLESFYEKSGSFTNTFGRVSPIRRATRVVEAGFEPLSVLSLLAGQVGESASADAAALYRNVARDVAGYPKSLGEVPESKQTYAHYERALWR